MLPCRQVGLEGGFPGVGDGYEDISCLNMFKCYLKILTICLNYNDSMFKYVQGISWMMKYNLLSGIINMLPEA